MIPPQAQTKKHPGTKLVAGWSRFISSMNQHQIVQASDRMAGDIGEMGGRVKLGAERLVPPSSYLPIGPYESIAA